ncbi:MAG TPA: LLM class flavin-dependent oxidoreductase, partial [Pseudogracilibacillus sp.]|nr:LLM class flavin-dependent oxidoreductase [Pseudogracilibacillus sp.]
MKLSILDQAPIASGQSPKEALNTSVKLAQLGEKLGYERFWIAEHHDLFGLACPNPDVMLGVIGAQTNSIRIGAGAVLLPYYKPFRVAETYNL